MYGFIYPSPVLILYLSTIAPYMLDRVVDRGGDSTIESFVVHPPCIGLVEPYIVWVVSSFGFDPPRQSPHALI
jgi:hypothetical protein